MKQLASIFNGKPVARLKDVDVRLILRWIGLGFVGMLALAACSSAIETGTRTEALDDAAVTSGDAGTGAVFTEQSGLYPAQNISMIANTGRPQFLNAFADW